jgi:tetratricopeptide (TPR) repeat protein
VLCNSENYDRVYKLWPRNAFKDLIRSLALVAVVLFLPSSCKQHQASAPPDSAQSESYDTVVSKGFAFFQQQKFQDSFAEAGKAINLDANRYEGYFLGGISLYKLDQLDSATSYFQKALIRAPQEQKAKVQEALAAAAHKKDFLVHMRLAQEADGAGLRAKAAREYTAAWDVFEVRDDAGFTAAELWVQLGDYLQADGILSVLIARPHDPEVEKKAISLHATISPQAERAFSEKRDHALAAFARGDYAEADAELQDLARTLPRAGMPHVDLALDAVAEGKPQRATDELAEALKRGLVNQGAIFGQQTLRIGIPALERLRQNDSFFAVYRDAYGPEGEAAAKRFIDLAVAQAAQARRDVEARQQAAVAAKEAQERAAQLAKENAERGRVEAIAWLSANLQGLLDFEMEAEAPDNCMLGRGDGWLNFCEHQFTSSQHVSNLRLDGCTILLETTGTDPDGNANDSLTPPYGGEKAYVASQTYDFAAKDGDTEVSEGASPRIVVGHGVNGMSFKTRTNSDANLIVKYLNQLHQGCVVTARRP